MQYSGRGHLGKDVHNRTGDSSFRELGTGGATSGILLKDSVAFGEVKVVRGRQHASL